MRCLLGARYVHKADVYKRIAITKASGQISYKWEFKNSIDCLVEPVASDGIRVSGTTERFSNMYENVDYVTLTAAIALGRSERVTRIRTKDLDQIVWKEEELAGTPPTWFNSNGAMPISDPWGKVLEYKTMLQRAETQGSG